MSDLNETGYLDKKIADGKYLVGFVANCHTSRARAFDFALMRSAEVGVRDGFPFFTIRDRREDTNVIDLGTTTYAIVHGNYVSASTTRDVATCPVFTFLIQYFRERPNLGLDLFKSGDTVVALEHRYGVHLAYSR
jgi:hypothetical protein